jgi:hypothetical protein
MHNPRRSLVALLLRFNVPLLMIAAFVIFVLGYLALFVSLLTFLAIATGLYRGAKRVQAYALRSALENDPISSDAEIATPREKRFVVPALTPGVGEASAGVSSY